MNVRHGTGVHRGLAALSRGTAWAVVGLAAGLAGAAEFRGRVVDAATGEPIPARVYLQNPAGEWLFVTSAAAEGSALP